jgi:hypothetical protein
VAEAATAGVVVGSTEEVSAVAVSTGEVSVVALSTAAVVVSVGEVSAVVVSTAVASVVDVLVGATSTITDSLMMCSSAASAFRAGGAGTIRTAITRTVTMAMDTAVTRTAMDTATMVTTVAPVMDIAMEAGRVTDIAMAADQCIPGVRGVGDQPGYGSLKYRRPVGVWRSNCK